MDIIYILLVAFCNICAVGTKSDGLEDNPEGNRVKRETESSSPWEINSNVCPPILCGPPLSLEIQGEPSDITSQSAPFPFFEGDIVLDTEQKARMASKKSAIRTRSQGKDRTRLKRSIVKPRKKLWKYGKIPFSIDQSFSDEMIAVIHRAHRHIETQTCIRFHEKTKKDKDYLMYLNQPGCWSYVGKTGKMQVVSLGYGCEKLGTAIHETCHALGFWHEQSRLDRGKYVNILLDNVSPSGREQFGKRSKDESYSKGYAYDYQSIMHYGEKYFSSNNKHTIEIKGIGEILGLKIGQRRGLSNIDVAQLNDVYYCNTKNQAARLCSKGWVPYDGRCYKFVSDEPQQHMGARSACLTLGSRLVHITNKNQDNFIKTILKEKYDDVRVWRTGGRRINDEFVWENPWDSRHREVRYKAWAAGHPASYTTMILSKMSNGTIVWKGTWAGAPSAPDKFSFPYICERKDYQCSKGWINWADKCYLFEREKQQFDKAHRKCVSKSSGLLHINSEEENKFITDYLINNFKKSEKWRTGGIKRDSKFCWYDSQNNYKKMAYKSWAPNQPGRHTTLVLAKNSGSPKRFVWIGSRPGDTTSLDYHKYSFICEKDATENCFQSSTKDGPRDYRGQLSYSEQGITCQKWTSQYPHTHDYMTGREGSDIRQGLGDHNYCRNPYGSKSRPWCYVTLKKTKWQYCDVSLCS